ncbi:MAG: hypothetical protein WBA43_23080 [Elainellaceae cyanobacterium]
MDSTLAGTGLSWILISRIESSKTVGDRGFCSSGNRDWVNKNLTSAVGFGRESVVNLLLGLFYDSGNEESPAMGEALAG